MDHKHILDVPTHADNDASNPASALFPRAFYDTEVIGNDASKPVSKFTPPIYIEMGDEDSELLESKVHEKTKDTVKADEDWTRLNGRRSIDTSIVAGFMFQTNAGSKCSITMTENGKRPIQILIDEKLDFGMFLVVVLRHEKWTTFGDFHLRFVRRVPVLTKQCTTRDGPVLGTWTINAAKPKNSGTSSMKELESATADSTESEENGYVGPLSSQPEIPEQHGDTTDEEDFRAIGAAGLREKYGGNFPPNKFPSTE